MLLNLTTPNPLHCFPHRNINNPDVANTFMPAWDQVRLPHKGVCVKNKNKSQLYKSQVLATISGGYSVCVLKLVCTCIYVCEDISFCCCYILTAIGSVNTGQSQYSTSAWWLKKPVIPQSHRTTAHGRSLFSDPSP